MDFTANSTDISMLNTIHINVVLIFLYICTIIITSEIPTFGNHIPGEAGTACGLPGDRRILILHSRAGQSSRKRSCDTVRLT